MRKYYDKSIKVIDSHSQRTVQRHCIQSCGNVGMLNQKIDPHSALYNTAWKTNTTAKIPNSAISMHFFLFTQTISLFLCVWYHFYFHSIPNSLHDTHIHICIKVLSMALSQNISDSFFVLVLFYLYSTSSYYYDLVYSSPRMWIIVVKNDNEPFLCLLILLCRKQIRIRIAHLFFFSFRTMDLNNPKDTNKRGFSLFGNYNFNEPTPNVPGKFSKID